MSNPVPRDTFARLYADADAERRLSLLAALFDARGWETTVADGAVRARRGETTRRFVPATDAGGGDGATAVDAGGGDGTTAVDADAAREALLYALDPDAADDVFDRHFGRPARSPDYDPTTAGPPDGSVTAGVRADPSRSPAGAGTPTSAADAPPPSESGADGSAVSAASEPAGADESGVESHDGGGGTGGGSGDGSESPASGHGPGTGSVAPVRGALAVVAVALVAAVVLGAGVGPAAFGGSSGAAAPANATETASPTGTPEPTTATPTETTTPSPWVATPSGSSGERYFSMRPTCERPPDDVVHLQVRALGYNQSEGVRVAYRFASPANKRFMGPFSAFRGIFRTDTYRPMLGYETATFERPSVDGDVARQNVTLRAGDATATYEFTLSKQEGSQYHGCWMTDTVERLDGS